MAIIYYKCTQEQHKYLNQVSARITYYRYKYSNHKKPYLDELLKEQGLNMIFLIQINTIIKNIICDFEYSSSNVETLNTTVAHIYKILKEHLDIDVLYDNKDGYYIQEKK